MENNVILQSGNQHPSVVDLWNKFLLQNPAANNREMPISFYFCDNQKDADECAELVIQRTKRATATSLWWFEKHNEPLPKIGDRYIITNWIGEAKAIVETTLVEQIPYDKISPEFAEIEGEGDKSLNYWKKVHREYYTREMKPFHEEFAEHMIIVCEQFKLIYTEKF